MGRKYIFIICLSMTLSLWGQTDLQPGDLAVVQYNSTENTDVIKFLTLVSLDIGTEIHFTDRGWVSETNSFRTEGSSEGVDTWIAAQSYSCGTVISVSLNNVDLRADGDQLLVYQGDVSSPVFIFALNNQGTNGEWQATATNNRNSGIPLGLTNTVNAVALSELSNTMYDASQITNESRPEILASICNKDNWLGSETVVQDFQGLFQSEGTYPSTFWNVRSQQNQSSYFHVELTKDYNTSTEGVFKTCICNLKTDKTLTIASGDMVVVESAITNRGTIVIEDDGAFVQTVRQNSNGGNGNYIVQKSSSMLKSEGLYTYWSSPTTQYSFLAHAIDAKLVYSYDAVMQLWVDEWNSDDPMVPGKGYAATGSQGVSYPSRFTASFEGSILNNGDVQVSLGFSNDLDDTNDANFIGNPYPSALDAEKFVSGNPNLAGCLYFWTHNSNDAGENSVDDYVFWNLTGGIQMCTECIEPNGKISVGQGFFVQAIAGGSVTFTNNMRIKEPNTNAIFYKGTSKQNNIPTQEKDRIRLNFSVNDSFSQVLIGFIQGATDGVDRLYDAARSLPESATDDNFSFFAFVNDAYFAILGQAPLMESEIIPLGYSSNFTGDFEISIGEKEGLLNTATIGLFDKETQTLHDLNTGPYAFSAPSGLYENRFELHIQSAELSADYDQETLSESPIGIKIKDGLLELHTIEKIKSIAIFDLLGSALPYQKIYNNDTKTGILVNKRGELFILKIQLDSGKVVTRKIIH